MAEPTAITDETFGTEVLKAQTPVMVDFWADWCGPCKAIAPIVAELADEYDGRMKFTKLDVDRNPQAAMSYGVRSIPTLLIFSDGKPMGQIVGAVSKQTLKSRIDEAIA